MTSRPPDALALLRNALRSCTDGMKKDWGKVLYEKHWLWEGL